VLLQDQNNVHAHLADRCWPGHHPDPPQADADGATYQEALANVEQIAQEWIEIARELGRDIPVPKGKLVYA
jgi:predicted RNase H-like HicB family nuclease